MICSFRSGIYVPAILTKIHSIHNAITACETVGLLSHSLDASARHFLYIIPETTSSLSPSLGWGKNSRNSQVQRLTEHLVSSPVSVTECPLPTTSESSLHSHHAPRVSFLPVKQVFSISSCNPLLLNFRQLVLHRHPFLFPKLPRHHLHPRPPV